MVKKIVFLFFVVNTSVANAQFYKAFLPSVNFTDSLARVVTNFRSNFRHIQGKRLESGNHADIFQSKAGIPGSQNCIIYRYHSVIDSSASWQAVMYSGESYKEALRAYKNTYRLLKRAKLLPTDQIGMEFHGEMDEPKEGVSFAQTVLQAHSSDPFYNKFVAETELVNFYDKWEVHLNLHNKTNDNGGQTIYK